MAFDRQLSTAMQAAVANGLDCAFWIGSRVGQTLGMVNSQTTIVQAKENGQDGNTLFIQSLSAMLARLTPSSYANAPAFCRDNGRQETR